MRMNVLKAVALGCLILASCSDDESFVLTQGDVQVEMPEGGFVAQTNQLLKITPKYPAGEAIAFEWRLDGEVIATTPSLEYMFEVGGEYLLTLEVSCRDQRFKYEYPLKVQINGEVDTPAEATPYVTRVLDYMPAVGQFTNTLPKYEEGDTQEDMNRKVLGAIGNNKKGMITLGGYGGYVVVGFDHTIKNVEGKRDFRVLANAFYSAANPDKDAPEGGSCEPGIIQVAYDVNKNGVPDENEWYEIAGSSHVNPIQEPWYEIIKNAGFDVNLYRNYELTYYRPEKEPASPEEWDTYIRWEDNQGHSGHKVKNRFHMQPYYPLWAPGDKLTSRARVFRRMP